MAEHPKIWLMPDCPCNDHDGGRMWCQDDNGPCEECGRQWVCYVLAPQPAVGDSPAAVNPSDAAIMAMYEPETLAKMERDSSAPEETLPCLFCEQQTANWLLDSHGRHVGQCGKCHNKGYLTPDMPEYYRQKTYGRYWDNPSLRGIRLTPQPATSEGEIK